jgi:predicted enzyme related to lactoylglutathione lyase
VDLATTDSVSAKTFYGELFGREAEEMLAGEARTYTI